MFSVQPIVIAFGVLRITLAADTSDPFDLSFFTKGAAIGDSYSAGIGAGNRVDRSCSRYDGSYANLVAAQIEVDPDAFDFTYTACSGAVIQDVNNQANALPTEQQFIIMSAGGNDADLVGILDSCVYSFWGGLSHPSCDNKLQESRGVIESNDFASRLDGLIANTKSKLASGGNIYYVGYAKFFDATDNTCDNVSWHIWLNLFTREYLTQARRQSMNDLVDLMNGALRAAVDRAGSQVHFVDYDGYVEMTNGRYCQPKQDESGGKGANRQDLFFYEMKSEDSPWLTSQNDWPHDELKRRQDATDDDGGVAPVNGTLNARIGALIQETVELDGLAVLEDDNANTDLEVEVIDGEQSVVRRHDLATQRRQSHPRKSKLIHGRSSNVTSNFTGSGVNASRPSYHGDAIRVGTSMTLDDNLWPIRYSTGGNRSANGTVHGSPVGTVVANSTHILLASGFTAEKSSIGRLLISDKTSRVFHPTQAGHAMIANLILYQMAADNAKALGMQSFPPADIDVSGGQWPQIGGAACTTDSSDTWASRDSMISALNSFCAVPQSLKGAEGGRTSANFNFNTFDYMRISIDWTKSGSIGEHSCEAWFDTVTDGCDVPNQPPGANIDNLKHGGTIAYQSALLDATMSIEPLVVRRIWDKGVGDGQACNDVGTYNYLDQATLQTNVNDYCTASGAQPGPIALHGSTFSRVYNEGTPDRVEIKTEWPTGDRNYEIFQEECRYYLGVLNNGCSLPGGDNRMNWKHGGSMSDKNGVKYTITPTQDRPSPPSSPRGRCYVESHWWGYSWDVWGGGFANSDTGRKLEDEIRGCGAVTGWSFQYYDRPVDGIEWHASGTLPLFISGHCLGKAIKSAGGYDSKC